MDAMAMSEGPLPFWIVSSIRTNGDRWQPHASAHETYEEAEAWAAGTSRWENVENVSITGPFYVRLPTDD